MPSSPFPSPALRPAAGLPPLPLRASVVPDAPADAAAAAGSGPIPGDVPAAVSRGVPGARSVDVPMGDPVDDPADDPAGAADGVAEVVAEGARLAEALRIAGVGFWTWDVRHDRFEASPLWTRIVGAPPGPTLAAGFLQWIAAEDRAALAERLANIRAERPELGDRVWRVVRADGTRRWVHVRGEYRYAADGTLVAARGTFQDVTARGEAETALRLAQEQQLALLEAIPDAALLKDAAGRLVAVNRAYVRLIGRDDVGRTTMETVPAEEVAEYLAHDRAALEADGPVTREHARVLPDGRERWFETTKAPYRDAAGRVAGIVAVARDVTDRRRLEAQMRQTQKMEALGLLAGSVAHDFNNLLSAILGGVELARLTVGDDNPAAVDLDDVRQAALRAAQLTRQLLAFGRQQPRHPRAVDVRDTVRNAETLLRRLLPDAVLFDVVLDDGPCVVEADPSQLEQVLLNLFINACDAVLAAQRTPPGGAARATTMPAGLHTVHGGHAPPHTVAVHLQALTLAADDPRLARAAAACGGALAAGPWVALAVADGGTGIPAAVLERIFEPFFTTKPAGHGTGLGLATVQRIVREHAGAVLVDSTPEAGTTFTVLLPGRPDADVVADVGGAAPLPGGTETILLVEDEHAVRQMAARILRRHGYTVIAARHGGDALLAWEAHAAAMAAGHAPPIALLVTDVRMPHMGGAPLVARLRAERPALPVIVISGYTSGDDAEEAALIARERYLDKPFTGERLLTAVRAALDAAEDGAPAG